MHRVLTKGSSVQLLEPEKKESQIFFPVGNRPPHSQPVQTDTHIHQQGLQTPSTLHRQLQALELTEDPLEIEIETE